MLSMMPSAWAVMSLPTFATIAAAAYEKYIPRIGCVPAPAWLPAAGQRGNSATQNRMAGGLSRRPSLVSGLP